MSRFAPDSWQEAALRPLALASPEAGVYVEFFAPDFRFVFIIVLLLACLVLRRRVPAGLKPVLALSMFVGLGFAAWMATSGNGRYFVPVLLLAGPLAVGFAHWLPVTRSLRVSAAAAMVLWQVFLLFQMSPWGVWNYVNWRSSPAFQVEVPPEWKREPATYVTLSMLSYAIIAPQFHPASRWINIVDVVGGGVPPRLVRQAEAYLAQGGPLRVIFPAVEPVPRGMPLGPGLADAIDRLLARQNLSLDDKAACRLLPAPSLPRGVFDRADAPTPGEMGFWACPLARTARLPHSAPRGAPAGADLVFRRLEQRCPSAFPPGPTSLVISAGVMRHYTGNDTRLYVFNDGDVMYKYHRSVNPERIGSVADVLRADFSMDCGQVRRRSALPWLREP